MSGIIQNSSQKDDAVTFQEDLFNRKGFGESIANLILNSGNESLTISIDANWGEGKTTFLKMWRNYLIKERSSEAKPLNVIYFDSFKNDFTEDPFLPLLSELLNYKKGNNSIFDSVKDKSKNVLKAVIPTVTKVGLRFVMGGDIQSVDDKIEEIIEGNVESFVNKTLDDYLKKEDSIKIFKDSIEEIIREKGQVIFIIDELDRCRPDFALRLLERIKHFFDIKGLYFVLGVNKKQILNYINKVYGNIESEEYLQKFIDIETNLPKSIEKNTRQHLLYLKEIYLEEDFKIVNPQIISNLIGFIVYFSTKFGFSLREIEKIMNYLLFFIKSNSCDFNTDDGYFILMVIFIKLRNNGLYQKLLYGRAKQKDLEEFIDIVNIENEYKDNLRGLFTYYYDSEITIELFDIIDLPKSKILKDRKKYIDNLIQSINYFNV